MNRELLQRVGTALYGPRWMTDLAKELAVTDRTLRRWIADDFVADWAWLRLRQLVEQRQREMSALLSELKKMAKSSE